jgi:anti-sigma B factor antagonist
VEIEVRSQASVKVIRLRGRLTLGESVDKLRGTIDDLLNSGQSRFVMDLSESPMIDSSGIGLLVKSLTAAKQHGGSLKLLNPTKFAQQTLKMIGLINLFEVYEDQQQAVDSFE